MSEGWLHRRFVSLAILFCIPFSQLLICGQRVNAAQSTIAAGNSDQSFIGFAISIGNDLSRDTATTGAGGVGIQLRARIFFE
jgi:hypothetical protein